MVKNFCVRWHSRYHCFLSWNDRCAICYGNAQARRRMVRASINIERTLGCCHVRSTICGRLDYRSLHFDFAPHRCQPTSISNPTQVRFDSNFHDWYIVRKPRSFFPSASYSLWQSLLKFDTQCVLPIYSESYFRFYLEFYAGQHGYARLSIL